MRTIHASWQTQTLGLFFCSWRYAGLLNGSSAWHFRRRDAYKIYSYVTFKITFFFTLNTVFLLISLNSWNSHFHVDAHNEQLQKLKYLHIIEYFFQEIDISICLLLYLIVTLHMICMAAILLCLLLSKPYLFTVTQAVMC